MPHNLPWLRRQYAELTLAIAALIAARMDASTYELALGSVEAMISEELAILSEG